MRKITEKAVNAFFNAEPLKLSNTEIVVLPNVTIMKLFNNEIAYRYNDPQKTLSITNAGWNSRTTRERLNGIGSRANFGIYQRKNKWFLNATEWDGKLIDIKILH
jgi:hypothetical protein